MESPLLQIKNLSVTFGATRAVDGLYLSLYSGDALAVVGESGSGKTQTFWAALGLLAAGGRASGEAIYKGRNLLAMRRTELDEIRGRDIALIFQNPLSALNPAMTIGAQVAEPLILHRGASRAAAKKRALEMLRLAGIADPARRMASFPHELSGGMRQRAMIAMALICEPKILIADEPTTALDVCVQAQIVALLRELRAAFNSALVVITHDLAIVKSLCERVLVMYAGRAAEAGKTADIFAAPRHPYTLGLLAATPRAEGDDGESPGGDLPTIPGRPPMAGDISLASGCAFAPRCPFAFGRCKQEKPELSISGASHRAACFLERKLSPTDAARFAAAL